MLKDFFGIPFRVGDRVVYPTRRGSELTMNSGRVIDVDEEFITVEPELRARKARAVDEGVRDARITETQRVVILGPEHTRHSSWSDERL